MKLLRLLAASIHFNLITGCSGNQNETPNQDPIIQTTEEVVVPFQSASEEIPMDYHSLYEFIAEEEGKGKPGRPGYVYKDTKNLLTVGIGHLIIDTDKELFKKLFGDDFDFEGLINGAFPLTDEQMMVLFERDVQWKLKTIYRQLTEFKTYPQYLKNAVVSAYYRGDIGPKTKRLLNEGKFEEASREYLDHGDYRRSKAKNELRPNSHGIQYRMERNAEAMARYGRSKRNRRKYPKGFDSLELT